MLHINEDVIRKYSLICFNFSSICFLSGYLATLSHFNTCPEFRLEVDELVFDVVVVSFAKNIIK